jgi:hypothetical protein
MRYFTAMLGALFIFIAVFFICGLFLTPFPPEFFRSNIQVGNFGTNNIAGVILGLAAAASSFFASLRVKR